MPFGPGFAHFKESQLATEIVIAVIGLSLNEAAYAAEVVRAGILSVDQGQHEAAHALGLPKVYQFRRIVLPQALRAIVPSYVNQLIGLIKGTSLIFYVSLLDLFGEVQSMEQHLLRRHHPAADRRDRLVRDPDQRPVDRAVLRRAVLLARRPAHAAADAAPTAAACRVATCGPGELAA